MAAAGLMLAFHWSASAPSEAAERKGKVNDYDNGVRNLDQGWSGNANG